MCKQNSKYIFLGGSESKLHRGRPLLAVFFIFHHFSRLATKSKIRHYLRIFIYAQGGRLTQRLS